MNRESLKKVIESLVLPKYPWIEDLDVSVHTTRHPLIKSKKIVSEKYTVSYYIGTDEDGTFTVTEDMQKLDSLTHTLFKMLGPKEHQRFDGIEIIGKVGRNPLLAIKKVIYST